MKHRIEDYTNQDLEDVLTSPHQSKEFKALAKFEQTTRAGVRVQEYQDAIEQTRATL